MATIAERDKALEDLYVKADTYAADAQVFQEDVSEKIRQLIRVAYDKGTRA